MQSQSQILNNDETIKSPRDAPLYSSTKAERVPNENKNAKNYSQNIVVASVGIEGGMQSKYFKKVILF